MASDAVEMATVFGTYETTKRALMLLSTGGAHPTEVVSVDDLPEQQKPAAEGLLADLPQGAGAAVHFPGEPGPHEARAQSRRPDGVRRLLGV